ncbi:MULTISPECIES: copper-binding protein [unclassified Serratia (in: enterobacteria)]|uniref:copper-binding protein n=1 Tax=unclassified Serratia (in: enterobacteria) TaxID=2647522 RepID=UPI000500A3CE|nr:MULTISPECIES: copper-binding protein [unclassified Serratia (in: enterobacteria)]KFK93320.1 copper-binding protein [Serratia sp. Ag2]KFK99759.1 copper-binding protein [Serratia sp. Ag1]
MRLITVIFISLFFSSAAVAEQMQHHQHAAPAEASVYHSTGVVKAWGDNKVLLAHPAIPALNWPPMTMNFLQPQPALPALAVGAQVDFSFRQVDGGYQLTAIRASQQ